MDDVEFTALVRETEKQAVASPIKPIVSRISEILNSGFMTCTSIEKGYYGLHIKMKDREATEELQLLLIKIRESC